MSLYVMQEHRRIPLRRFPGKNLIYVRDDKEIGAGLRIEFGDYILDYTVTNMVVKIMKGIRESL